MPGGKILENLAEMENCFISSLRDSSEIRQAFYTLEKADPMKYTLSEWEYSLSYLMGHPVKFDNYSDLSAFLISYGRRFVRKIS